MNMYVERNTNRTLFNSQFCYVITGLVTLSLFQKLIHVMSVVEYWTNLCLGMKAEIQDVAYRISFYRIYYVFEKNINGNGNLMVSTISNCFGDLTFGLENYTVLTFFLVPHSYSRTSEMEFICEYG